MSHGSAFTADALSVTIYSIAVGNRHACREVRHFSFTFPMFPVWSAKDDRFTIVSVQYHPQFFSPGCTVFNSKCEFHVIIRVKWFNVPKLRLSVRISSFIQLIYKKNE